jgi:hypothetical protein
VTTLRSRQQRRKADRAPGIWRGPQGWLNQREIEHGVRSGSSFNWRWISGLIVISFSLSLLIFFMMDYFYVRNIAVAGTYYLDEAEVFRYADIAETHIFWVDAADVRANIVEHSKMVADARVTVGWPPDMVRVVVEEREPALAWVQDGITAWVSLQGEILRYPRDNESYGELLHIVADMPGIPGEEAAIPQAAVNGALQLQTLFAGIQELRYDPVNGLGFRESEGWDVWLGVGTDMSDKLVVYDRLRAELIARGITPVEINVSHLDGGIYYCESVEFCQ